MCRWDLFGAWQFAPEAMGQVSAPIAADSELTNTEALGQLVYTKYFLPFQLAGLILLVAMIGAIVLTHRQRSGVYKQRVAEQFARKREDAMEVRKVSSGSGA